jgi:DNA polymerase III epsilon subunit-like protein
MIHLIVVDTETGGFDPAERCIIELSAQHVLVEHDAKQVVAHPNESFHRFVKPDRPVSEGAAAVNGYSEKAWAGAQRMREVARAFIGWLYEIPHDGLVWTGSNVTGFDLPFLHSDFGRVELALPGKPKFSRRVLNTESLCFPLLVKGEVEHVGIEALRTWAGLSGEQKHTAKDDVADTITIISRYFYKEVWGA